jgi:hypothetical protein
LSFCGLASIDGRLSTGLWVRVFDLVRTRLEQMALPCKIMSVTFQILNTFSLSLTYEVESTTGGNYPTVPSHPGKRIGG